MLARWPQASCRTAPRVSMKACSAAASPRLSTCCTPMALHAAAIAGHSGSPSTTTQPGRSCVCSSSACTKCVAIELRAAKSTTAMSQFASGELQPLFELDGRAEPAGDPDAAEAGEHGGHGAQHRAGVAQQHDPRRRGVEGVGEEPRRCGGFLQHGGIGQDARSAAAYGV